MKIKLFIKYVAETPLAILTDKKFHPIKKGIALIAAASLTVLSCGYYIVFSKNYFSHRKVQDVRKDLETHVFSGNVAEVKKLFVKYPYLKKALNAKLPFKATFDLPCFFLHIALVAGNKEMVEFFISQNADVEALSRCGTPLESLLNQELWAKEHPNGDLETRKDMLKLLINANVKLMNGPFVHPLFHPYAYQAGISTEKFEIIKILIEKTDVNAKSCLRSPLAFAAQQWQPGMDNKIVKDLLSLLVAKGAKFRKEEENDKDTLPEALEFIKTIALT